MLRARFYEVGGSVALALILLSTAPSGASAKEPGLDGDPARIRSWVESLRSPHKAEWRRAQIRLASSGPAALDALERSGSIASEPVQSRVRLLLSLAMLTTTTAKDLEQYPRLHRLVNEEIIRAFTIVAPYATRGTVMSHMPPELARLGGFAVPAILALCRSPHPSARGYGAVFLQRLRATVAIDSLKRLTTDGAEFRLFHGDYFTTGSPGQSARDAIQYLSRQSDFEAPLVTMDLLNDAYDGVFDLINGIRRVAGYDRARSWDEWWSAAEPVWTAWWGLARGAERPPDREAWANWLSEREGYLRYDRPASGGATRLVVSGPPGTHGRVRSDRQTLADRELPIRLIAATDSEFVAWWRDSMPPFVERYLEIEATLPNGATWQRSMTVEYGMETRIELLPTERKEVPRSR